MNEEYIINQNPNFIYRKQIEENIKNNNGFCLSVTEQTEDTKCICSAFKEQQSSGWCKCGQYYKILKPQTICLCGINIDKEQVLEIAKDFTLQGYIVLISSLLFNESLTQQELQKIKEIHKTEIAEADFIYIIVNKDNLTELDNEEIQWATQLGKKIRFIDEEEIV